MTAAIIYVSFAIVVTTVVSIIFKRKTDAEEKAFDNTFEMREELRKRWSRRSLIKGLMIVFFVFTGFAVTMFDLLIYDLWVSFNDERISYIEENYGLTIDDKIELKQYRRCFGRDGSIEYLTFECDDLHDVIDNNYDGEIYYYEDSGFCFYYSYDVEDYVTEEIDMSDRGKYEVNGKCYSFMFTKRNGKYHVNVYN